MGKQISGQGQNLEDPVEAGCRNGRTGDAHGGETDKWTGPESNWRHTAFQAVALPTELPVRKFLKLANERSDYR